MFSRQENAIFLIIFTEPGKNALAHPCTYTKLLHKHAPRMRIWAGPPSLPAYCMLRQTGNDCGVTLFHRLLTLALSPALDADQSQIQLRAVRCSALSLCLYRARLKEKKGLRLFEYRMGKLPTLPCCRQKFPTHIHATWGPRFSRLALYSTYQLRSPVSPPLVSVHARTDDDAR